MAISFVQWEKYVQSFPDDRLGQEFQNPGSTVAGEEKPPQAVIIAEMGTRNAARQADEAMKASQGQPSGTIGEQTYEEFAGESRPPGGPGGGPPPGGPPPGGPGGPPPGGPPPGGPPMGPGGPPPGGPPVGGPPMMAYGGSVPGYQYGGSIPGYQDGGDTEKNLFMRGLGGLTKFATGADSFQDAAENPFRTLGHTALTGMMFVPGVGLVGAGGRALLGGARVARGLGALGRGTLALGGQGGRLGSSGNRLARMLGGSKRITPGGGVDLTKYAGRSKDFRAGIHKETFWPKGSVYPKGHAKAGQLRGGQVKPMSERAIPSMIERDIGRAALLRGGGTLGVASLLALDPFDAGNPEEAVPPPNTDPSNSSAVRADRAKGFANGAYDWLDEESPTERNLRRLLDYRSEGIASGELTEDFQDESLREFIEDLNRRERSSGYVAPRQGYADLPEMASGGFAGMGYHEGGNIPIHEHGSGPGQHLVDDRDPGPPWGMSINTLQMTGQPFMADTLYTSPEGEEGYMAPEALALRAAPTIADILAEEEAMTEGLTDSEYSKARMDRVIAQMDETMGGSRPPEGEGAFTPSHYEHEDILRDYVARAKLGSFGDATVGRTPPPSVMSQVPDSLAAGEIPAAIADTVPQTTRGMDSGPGQGMSPRPTAPMAAAGSGQPWQPGDEVPMGYKPVSRWSGDLATPEGSYATGERSVPGDVGRFARRLDARLHDAGQSIFSGAKNIYEAMLPGQQFGPDERNAEGRLLRMGQDRELYDPDLGEMGGNREWTLVPMSEEEMAAEGLGGPEGPVEETDLGGMGSQSAPGGDPLSLDETIGLADKRLYDATLAMEEELRTQNPAERAQERYWDTRLGRERDNRRNLLAADIAETIGSRRGTGDIARGLANAARNQVEQGRLITDLEGLPFAEDVRRSRESTYRDRLAALGGTANRLGSRGELEATLQQRMAEIEATLSRGGRLTAGDMAGIEEILSRAERYELMDQEEINAWRTSYMQKFLNDGFPDSAR